MLDLHTHTTASDGSLTPSELVELADQLGLTALAVTDHDTIGGLPEAVAAASSTAVELVTGVELSATCDRGAIHIVGLYIDYTEPRLLAGLARVRDLRRARNELISRRLAALGRPVHIEELAAANEEEVVGRPHFAQAMVDRGYVDTTEQAFARYLAVGGVVYVPKQKLAPIECIQLIRGAGGVPVLAHPDQTELRGSNLRVLVGRLAVSGLAGIEAYCPAYSASSTREYRQLALEYDLVESGGTDFHGAIKPKLKLGRGFGSFNVPDALLAPITAAAAAIRRQECGIV